MAWHGPRIRPFGPLRGDKEGGWGKGGNDLLSSGPWLTPPPVAAFYSRSFPLARYKDRIHALFTPARRRSRRRNPALEPTHDDGGDRGHAARRGQSAGAVAGRSAGAAAAGRLE